MIVAGFGFRSGASQASLTDALARANAPATPALFATLSRKADDLRAFADARATPLRAIEPDQAERQATLTQSQASAAKTGLGSVAEACALAAAGPGARLLAPRVISDDKMATCAIAIGDPA